MMSRSLFFFFFNDTATTEIYTLSLHDALPISPDLCHEPASAGCAARQCDHSTLAGLESAQRNRRDRKSTRLNSSHDQISYAVFCLKKKKKLLGPKLFGVYEVNASSVIVFISGI